MGEAKQTADEAGAGQVQNAGRGAIMVFSRLAAFSGTKKLIHSPCQGKQIWTFLSRGTPGHVTLWLWWIET